jgi:hypothetical protein
MQIDTQVPKNKVAKTQVLIKHLTLKFIKTSSFHFFNKFHDVDEPYHNRHFTWVDTYLVSVFLSLFMICLFYLFIYLFSPPTKNTLFFL